ncbi:uncharacterized protein [Hyperolius riggenbachi]
MDFYSVEFLPEFIEVYRRHTCLWKVKSTEYHNKIMKRAAKEEFVALCKMRGTLNNPDVHVRTKKIHNLRTIYQRELKRANKSKKSGSAAADVHTPKLWYFHLLEFTADQLDERESIHNLEDDDSMEDGSTSSIADGLTESDAPFTQASSDTTNEDVPTHTSTPIKNTTKAKSYRQAPRKKLTEEEIEKENVLKRAMNLITEDVEEEEEDPNMHFGKSIVQQLGKLSQEQAFLAKVHIQQILADGYFGLLTNPRPTGARPPINNNVMFSIPKPTPMLFPPSNTNHYPDNPSHYQLQQQANAAEACVNLSRPPFTQLAHANNISQTGDPSPSDQGGLHYRTLICCGF